MTWIEHGDQNNLQQSGIIQNTDPNSGVHNDDCHLNSNVNHQSFKDGGEKWVQFLSQKEQVSLKWHYML